MSDRNFGLLLQAVGWIEHHAGVDAPEYPHLGMLSEVVDNIDKRRQRGVPYEYGADSSGIKRVVYLIGAGDGDYPLRTSSLADGSPETLGIPCFACGGRVPVRAEPGEATCTACGRTMCIEVQRRHPSRAR